MPRGGSRAGAGRKRKLSPEQERLISDNCNTLFWLIRTERYRQTAAKAMPRFAAFQQALIDKIARGYSPVTFAIAEETGTPLPPRLLSEDEREDERADAEIAVKKDIGLLPRNIDRLPEERSVPLMDAEHEMGGVYWTFTPSIQSIEAEVKKRAKQALANVGIDVSEKTIGRVWKRDYWPES